MYLQLKFELRSSSTNRFSVITIYLKWVVFLKKNYFDITFFSHQRPNFVDLILLILIHFVSSKLIENTIFLTEKRSLTLKAQFKKK